MRHRGRKPSKRRGFANGIRETKEAREEKEPKARPHQVPKVKRIGHALITSKAHASKEQIATCLMTSMM